MHTADLIRWSLVSGLAAALLRWPHPGAPFWAVVAGRPFVVTRTRLHPADFRGAVPA